MTLNEMIDGLNRMKELGYGELPVRLLQMDRKKNEYALSWNVCACFQSEKHEKNGHFIAIDCIDDGFEIDHSQYKEEMND